MAAENRGEISAVEKQLLARGDDYNLIQVLRILRRMVGDDGKSSFFERVRVRPDLSFSAPRGEVCSVEKFDKEHSLVKFEVTTSILQLYGTGSPLPLFYTQELIHEQNQGASVSREFLDIINGIIYESNFSLWRKCSILASLFEAPDADFWERLFCLCGLGGSSLKKHFSFPEQFIAFSAPAARPVKTAEGLRSLLSALSKTSGLTVEQCIARKASIPIDQRCLIGRQGNVLGDCVYLGASLLDRMNAIRIHIGPLDQDALDRYLPDAAILPLFNQAIRFYIDRLIIWDYAIGVYTAKLTTVQLGKRKSALLGWNTWIFSGRPKQDIVYTTIKPKNKP